MADETIEQPLAEEDSPGPKANVERRIEGYTQDRFPDLPIHSIRDHRLDPPETPETDEATRLQMLKDDERPDSWRMVAASQAYVRKQRQFGEIQKNAPTAGGIREVEEGDSFVS